MKRNLWLTHQLSWPVIGLFFFLLLVVAKPAFGDRWADGFAAPGVDGNIYAMVRDKSGNLYVGGDFKTAGGIAANGIAKWDGACWSAFGSGLNNETGVHAMAFDDASNLYIAAGANCLAKWDGRAWSKLPSLTSTSLNITALVFAGGYLYAGGSFDSSWGAIANYIARWDPNRNTWSAVGNGVNGYVTALAADGKGNLFAGGSFTSAGGIAANHMAKWDGANWSPLAGGTDKGPQVLICDGSGNLYAGGAFTSAGGVTANSVAKWNGNTWSALGTGISNYDGTAASVRTLAFDANGNLWAGGIMQGWTGSYIRGYLMKWDGSVWAYPARTPDKPVYAIAADNLGNFYIGGSFLSIYSPTLTVNHIAKGNGANWSRLPEKNLALNDAVSALLLDKSGKLYAGGSFTLAGDVAAKHVAGWDGSAWSPLGSGTDFYTKALALDGSGNLYAGGTCYPGYGFQHNSANCLTSWNGSGWSSLGSVVSYGDTSYPYDPWVSALLGVDDGVIAGGNFQSVGGVTLNNLGKWNATSQTWSPLGSGIRSVPGDPLAVYALAGNLASRLYAGGSFDYAGDCFTYNIACLFSNFWSPLSSDSRPGGTSGAVYALATDAGGNLYVGGRFDSVDLYNSGQGRVFASNVAKWDPDKRQWSALGSGVYGTNHAGWDPDVWALALDASGNLYVGGHFTTAGGKPANNIAKWDPVKGEWSPLGNGIVGPEPVASDDTDHISYVQALAFDNNTGKLYVGGYFNTAGDKASKNLAIWETVSPKRNVLSGPYLMLMLD